MLSDRVSKTCQLVKNSSSARIDRFVNFLHKTSAIRNNFTINFAVNHQEMSRE
jgi:hypothetical protein